MFRGLDQLLFEAEQRGLRVIVALSSYWVGTTAHLLLLSRERPSYLESRQRGVHVATAVQ